MSEYGGKQRNQLSKAISSSESQDVQLQRFEDNRPQTNSQLNLINSIQKKVNKNLTTNNTIQLKKIDVVARGITHLVHLNEQGSLYQEDFMQNEVAETRPGDSIVIETAFPIFSRRGPNQEQNFSRDKNAESSHLWINAITHNDEYLPSYTFIRKGTFDKRRVPKTVYNLASGTVPETLMHEYAEQQQMFNLDSGHMAVADAVFANMDEEGVIEGIVNLLMEHNPNGQFGLTKAYKTTDARREALETQMKNPKTLMTNLKLLLHHNYPGYNGVQQFLMQMPPIIIKAFRKKSKGIELGDLSIGDRAHGKVDIVHMVNAYGFDPINDIVQVQHLATMLKPGGRLVITAETTGPTVKPFFKGYEGDMSPDTLFEHVSRVLETYNLGNYFTLGSLVYPHGIPLALGLRSDVMPRNAFTASMISTRHTMPSVDTTRMPDVSTLQITFIRNEQEYK